MKSDKNQIISLRFLILMSLLLLVIGLYSVHPTVKIAPEENFKSVKKIITKKNNNYIQVSKPVEKKEKIKFVNKEIKTETITPSYTYNSMLDELKQYPSKNISSLTAIINKIIKNKGYRENLIKVKVDDTISQGSYTAAYFDIPSGEIHVNKDILYKLSTKETVAILAHEIEHFDTVAKLVRVMGEDEFLQFMQKNNIKNINKEFWSKAAKQAYIRGFKPEYYKEALQRYINQNRLDLISIYADLYIISEKIRNPIEISAYNLSDYIIDYYNLPKNEGMLRNIVKEFNNTDWIVYNISKENKYLKNERIALFDYFLINPIINSDGKYKKAFEYCVTQGNSDLTQFWKTYKNNNKSLFNNNQRIDKETYNNIIRLLKEAQKEGKKKLTPQDITNALKYKTYTLLPNLLFNNSIKQLENCATDFIKYGKENNTLSSEDELKLILILICIENKIYTHTTEQTPSLYYLKLPKVLEDIYQPKNKAQKYFFIYNNQAFKNRYKAIKEQQANYTEQMLLTKLIEDNRLYNNAAK